MVEYCARADALPMRRLPMLSLLLCLGAWTEQASPTVGFVLSIDGPWQVQGRAIRQGEAVPAGVRVLLAAGTTFDPNRTYWVDIVLLDSQHRQLRCSSAQACRTGLLMPGSLVNQSPFGTRLFEVFRLIFSTPERYVGLMSRGESGDRAGFVDGVAKVERGRLEMSPFFRGLPDGTYRLQFERAPGPDGGTRPPDLEVAWNRSPASATPSATIDPALYRVTLLRERDAAFGPFESWILVTDAAGFDAAAAAFDETMRSARGWGRNVPARDIAVFRHAYLAHLAASRR